MWSNEVWAVGSYTQAGVSRTRNREIYRCLPNGNFNTIFDSYFH